MVHTNLMIIGGISERVRGNQHTCIDTGMPDFLPGQEPFVILTDPVAGLTMHDADRAAAATALDSAQLTVQKCDYRLKIFEFEP